MNAKNPNANANSVKETVAETASDVKDETVSRMQRFKSNPTVGKLKNAAAVVGVVTIAGVAAATVAKKKSAKVEVTLPDVDVTTNDV